MSNLNKAYKSMAYMEMVERNQRRRENYKWVTHSEEQLVVYSYLQKEINKINKKYGQEQMPRTVLFETKEQRMDYNGRTARGKAAYAREMVKLADLRYERNVLANVEKISREDKELALKYKEECENKANQIFNAYREVAKIREENKNLVWGSLCIGIISGVVAIFFPLILIMSLSIIVAAIVKRITNKGYGGSFKEKMLEKYIAGHNEEDHKE